MNEALLMSNVVLWLVVIALTVLVVVLTRQIGVLHERVAPVGALMAKKGPKVGELAPTLNVMDLNGTQMELGMPNAAGNATMIFFLSPTCPVCRILVPIVRSLARSEGSRLDLVFASDGDEDASHRAYVRDHDIEGFPYVLSTHLGLTFQVDKLPYAVLIDSDGVLRAKGLVNTREHLESLIEAMDSGVPTLQDYVKQRSEERVA